MRVDFEIHATRDAGGVMVVEGIAYPALRQTEGKIPKSEAFRIDSYRTWMSPDTLRTFAHRMLERGTGGIDSQHDHENVGVIVESHYRLEASGEYPSDVWVVAVKVLRADTQEAVRSGKLTGFSIEFTARYREAVLDLDGIGRMKTSEIITPYPLTLSIVDRPAIRLPFTSVEARAEGDDLTTDTELAARCAVPTDHDGRGVTVLVRYAPEEEHPPMSEKTTPTEAAPAAASDPAVTATPATEAPAARAEGAAPTTETPAARAETAPAASDPEALKRAVRETMLRGMFRAASDLPEGAVERVADALKRSDWNDLASVWEMCAAEWTLRDACRSAMYAAESVLWEILYGMEGPEKTAALRKIATDLAVILDGICATYEADGGTEARAARSEAVAKSVGEAVAAARAGKKLSKASRSRIEKAHDSAEACRAELRGMLDETAESEGEGESEDASQACSAPADAATEAAPVSAPETPAATVASTEAARSEPSEGERFEAAMKAHVEKILAAQRAEFDASLAKVRDEVGVKNAELDAAKKRVAELESARPAPRSGEGGAPPAKPAEERTGETREKPYRWGLGLQRFARTGVATPIASDDES